MKRETYEPPPRVSLRCADCPVVIRTVVIRGHVKQRRCDECQRIHEQESQSATGRRERAARWRMECGHCGIEYDGRKGYGLFCTAECAEEHEPVRVAHQAVEVEQWRKLEAATA